MAQEKIITKLRPGFPKESNDGKSNRTLLEYVGLEKDLRASGIKLGNTWGDYLGIVSDAQIEPLDLTDFAILAVTCELRYDQTAEITGSKQETSYELDWVTIARPLKEHPEFNGGAFNLDALDLVKIELWEESTFDRKSVYKYETAPGDSGSTSFDLSESAKKYAAALLQGIETYDDHVPVIRISETWVNGPPPSSSAGEKGDPPHFPNKPTGYEWIQTADRSLRAGGQFRWSRDKEWMGVAKVLADSKALYYSTP